MKDTVRIGAITETKAILRFLELGYNVFTPFGDGSKCDLIIQDTNGILSRVQCKTSRFNLKSEVFNAYSTNRTRSIGGKKVRVRYTKEDIDFFCTFNCNGDMYLIPVEMVKVSEPKIKIFNMYIL